MPALGVEVSTGPGMGAPGSGLGEEEAPGLARPLPSAFQDALESRVEPVDAKVLDMFPPEMPARLSVAEPVVEPVGGEDPRAIPPEMPDGIPDELINDDILEAHLLKKMQYSLKRVYIHHKVMFP